MMELIRTSGSEWVTDGFEKKKKKKNIKDQIKSTGRGTSKRDGGGKGGRRIKSWSEQRGGIWGGSYFLSFFLEWGVFFFF